MKIHHIGYLVKKLDRAVSDFEKLGYEPEDLSGTGAPDGVIRDQGRKAEIVFMRNGPYRVELVCPMGEDSPVYGLMKKYKNSPYHICYVSDQMERDILELERNGWKLFEPASPAPAIRNMSAAFLMSPNSGMIELVGEVQDS